MSENVNDLLSDWLDDEEPKSTSTEDEVIEGSSEAVADSLVVHGLLADQGRRDDEQEAQCLRSVMERIDSEDDAESVTLAQARRPSWCPAGVIRAASYGSPKLSVPRTHFHVKPTETNSCQYQHSFEILGSEQCRELGSPSEPSKANPIFVFSFAGGVRCVHTPTLMPRRSYCHSTKRRGVCHSM